MNSFLMPISLQTYEHLLTSLRRGPTKYGTAPHKPVLLLSLVDRMEESGLQDNAIPVDRRLFELFRRNWKALVRTGNVSDITLPLHHLSDGLGWELIGTDGRIVEHKLSSRGKVLEQVRCGRFDPAFFSFPNADRCYPGSSDPPKHIVSN